MCVWFQVALCTQCELHVCTQLTCPYLKWPAAHPQINSEPRLPAPLPHPFTPSVWSKMSAPVVIMCLIREELPSKNRNILECIKLYKSNISVISLVLWIWTRQHWLWKPFSRKFPEQTHSQLFLVSKYCHLCRWHETVSFGQKKSTLLDHICWNANQGFILNSKCQVCNYRESWFSTALLEHNHPIHLIPGVGLHTHVYIRVLQQAVSELLWGIIWI